MNIKDLAGAVVGASVLVAAAVLIGDWLRAMGAI